MTRHVLIAEDDLALQDFFAKVFRSNDFEVVVTDDGDQVMDYLTERLPDVLMLDIGLPGKTGLEILRHVREYEYTLHQHGHHQTVNIILVTGYDFPENMAAGNLADIFLVKPVSIYQLLAIVEAFNSSSAAAAAAV